MSHELRPVSPFGTSLSPLVPQWMPSRSPGDRANNSLVSLLHSPTMLVVPRASSWAQFPIDCLSPLTPEGKPRCSAVNPHSNGRTCRLFGPHLPRDQAGHRRTTALPSIPSRYDTGGSGSHSGRDFVLGNLFWWIG